MKTLIAPILVTALLVSLIGAEVLYVQVGENVSLKPPSNMQQKYIYWYFNGLEGLQLAWLNPMGGSKLTDDKPWNNRLTLSGSSLIIRNITDELFGTIYCKVADQRSVPNISTYKLVKISVKKPASPLLPGESLSLGCDVNVHQGQRKPSIHWLNPQNEKVEGNSGGLELTTESRHNGSWTCVLGNEKRVQIVVPVIDLAPAPARLYTSVESRLTVPCSIPPHISWQHIKKKGIKQVEWHFVPNPSPGPASDERQRLFFLSLEGPMTWKKDQHKGLRPASDPTSRDLSLPINQVGEKDRGDYICSMTFENGVTVKRTVHVEVLQVTSSEGTHINLGQSVNLSCSTGGPLPSDIQLKWFPPKESPAPDSDQHAPHLAIMEAGAGDGGQWRCELWRGNKKLASAVLMLKIEPKLSLWMLLIICSAAVILIILIIILTVILHRRRQRKNKHHRHRLCQCKHPKPKGFYRT